MNEGPLRVGLVGAGAIAQTYVEALATEPDLELVGVADPRPKAAEATAEATAGATTSS